MSRFTIQLLTALVLLIAGPAGGAPADGAGHGRAGIETLGAPAELIAADAFPAAFMLAAVAGADLDGRTGRSSAPRQSPLHGPSDKRSRSAARNCHSTVEHSSDIASRLQRGGLASSSLGTPPPDA